MKSIRLLILSLLMVVSLTVAASSSVTLSSVQGVPGDTLTVIVNLNTTDAASGVDLSIPLGNYLKYVPNSALLSSARSNGHALSASQVGDNLRLVVYSFTSNALTGQSGELMRFDIVLGKEPGVYSLTPRVILGDADGETITSSLTSGSVTILVPKIELNSSEIDFGHIPIRSSYSQYLTIRNTGTSVLNITSITFSDSEMSCQLPSSIAAGGSRMVTINYSPTTHGATTATMNIFSNATNGKQTVRISADPFSVNELHLMHAEGASDDTVEVFMTMNNMESIVGMQCCFQMPDGLEVIPNSFSVAQRAADHVATTTISHDTVTLMAYSLSSTPFTGNNGTLGSFKIRLNGSSNWYYLNPYHVVLGNAAGENMVSASYGEYVAISAPQISVASQLDMGNVSVTETGRVGLPINNYSSVNLQINRVTFLSEGYSIASQLPIVIQGYGHDTLWIEANPSVEGSFSTTMQVYSNDPASRITSVNVHGVAYEPNLLNTRGYVEENGDYRLVVGLDNYSDIVGLQMDIHWLDSMTTSSSVLTLKPRANGLSSVVSKISDGTYRVVLFSLNNTSLAGNSGDVLELLYSGDRNYNHTNIVIDRIVAGGVNGDNKISEPSESLYVDLKQVSVAYNSTRGIVIGGGLYNVGDTAVLVASVSEDYVFAGWSNGEFDDTLYVVVNSDISLTANFAHYPYLFEVTDTACQNDGYFWHGKTLSVSGVYYDSLKTSEGIDSVYKLTLIVNPAYLIHQDTIWRWAYPGNFYWRGKTIKGTGVYYDSLTTANGCDSVYELNIIVAGNYMEVNYMTICQGEQYMWRGHYYSEAGVYYDSLKTIYGCDSVYELMLIVKPSYVISTSYNICPGETYNWHNMSLTRPGYYYDYFKTKDGCDSIYQLILKANPTYEVNDTAVLPNGGGGYQWHGKVYYEAGDYIDSLKTQYGCDSICNLHLSDSLHTSVDNPSALMEISLAPNPIKAGEVTYIYAEWSLDMDENVEVDVVDMSGRIIKKLQSDEFPIAIDGITIPGAYLIRIRTTNGELYTRKLLVK